ncbi:alpha-tocopherol transfer protein-like [Cochliomyia hominivorax]
MANIKPLPAELQKIAENELGEITEKIPQHLQILKSWIEQQPHLNARLEEQFLIQFLRGCKYNLEKAKEKIDLFYTLKTKFPELLNVTDINEPIFRQMHDYGLGVSLPRPLNGTRIYFLKFDGEVAKGDVELEHLYRVSNAMHEIFIRDDPYACINGIIYILDLKDISINMVTKLTPVLIRKLIQFYEKSLPLRIKAIHFINTPSIFHTVVNIMLPIFSEKLRKRIYIYDQNYEDLYKLVPKEYLPIDVGGENGSRFEIVKDFEKKWLEYENYFKENSNYGTNELLRPGKPIDFDSLYGLGGTFRKLNVD